MNIVRVIPQPTDLGNLIIGNCFKVIEEKRESVYMIVNMPKFIINKEAPSIPPIGEAVFAINIGSGEVNLFAKDVSVIEVYATLQYVY